MLRWKIVFNTIGSAFRLPLVIFPMWNIQLKDNDTSRLIKNETTLTKELFISIFDVWYTWLPTFNPNSVIITKIQSRACFQTSRILFI